jgi:hypothetical protein
MQNIFAHKTYFIHKSIFIISFYKPYIYAQTFSQDVSNTLFAFLHIKCSHGIARPKGCDAMAVYYVNSR